ncbi:MAG: hypothetical protein HOP28_04030 [Gemmatimonadales bacterium]|nr:hypothetical protein [Gemmatimonadales bacterium]
MSAEARPGLRMVVAGTIGVALAYGSAFRSGGAPAWGVWAMIFGIALLAVGMMALGASRPGKPLGALRWSFLFTFVVLVGGFGAAFLLPRGETAASPLWGGMPLRAALILYGIGFLPAIVLPLAYALTFDRSTLEPGKE